MQEDVIARSTEEACGLVTGIIDGEIYQALEVMAMTNILHSPHRYRLDPQEQWDAFMSMEARGHDLVAIYHSHLEGPESPSATDIAEAYYPDCLHLIWSIIEGSWMCLGFRIQEGQIMNARLEIEK